MNKKANVRATAAAFRTEVKNITAERDGFQQLLIVAREDMRDYDVKLTSLKILYEGQKVSAIQAIVTQKKDAGIIKHQAFTLAESLVSHLEDAATIKQQALTMADSVISQRVAADTIKRQAITMAELVLSQQEAADTIKRQAITMAESVITQQEAADTIKRQATSMATLAMVQKEAADTIRRQAISMAGSVISQQEAADTIKRQADTMADLAVTQKEAADTIKHQATTMADSVITQKEAAATIKRQATTMADLAVTQKSAAETIKQQATTMADSVVAQKEAEATIKQQATCMADSVVTQKEDAATIRQQATTMADSVVTQRQDAATIKRQATTMADSVITQREDAATIERQSTRMADQVDALSHMTTERDKSATHAARLQVDVTEQTLQMREKEELLALVLKVSVDGVLVYRSLQAADGTIADFECVLNNPAAEKIYRTQVLAGKHFLELHPDASAKELWKRYVQVAETGGSFEGDYCYDPVEPAQWFRMLAVKVAGGIAITLSDISQRKRMEAQILTQLDELKQADDMKNQFLGIISHELRTPINSIMGFASILDDEMAGALTPTQHLYVAKISTGSDVLLSLVDNLLDMSRIQAGKFSVDPCHCDFGPIVVETLASLEALAGTRTVINEIHSPLPAILADEHRVSQVLTNLIANAIKFTPPTGTITLRALEADGFLRCEVVDTGIGIAAADLPRLFNVFVQLNMTNTRTAGGTGLGLTIAKTLIEAHGGAMGVESVEGNGSTFWFTLPLVSAPSTAG